MALTRIDNLTSTLPSGYSYSRSGVGTRYGSTGSETNVTANNPRFNHNRVTPFTARGLMFEAARTNNFQQSLSLDNAYWNATSNVAPFAVSGGFDDDTTAFAFTDANGVAMGNGFAKTTGLGITISNPCISMRMKYVSRRYYEFCVVFASGTKRFYYDLQTGAYLNSAGVPFTNGGMIDEGNGWYRCWAYLTGSQTVNQVYIVPRGALDSTLITGNGSVAFAQRPQLESGPFPSSTINTTTASLTRGLDICLAEPPLNLEESFAVLLKYNLLSGASAGGPLLHETEALIAIPSDGTGCQVARFDANTATAWYSGNGVAEEAGSYVPTSVGLYIGSDNSSLALNGCISQVQWWQGAMSDAVMLSSAAAGRLPLGAAMFANPFRSPFQSPFQADFYR